MSDIEIIPVSSFNYHDSDDDYLYHVTSEPSAHAIAESGFRVNARGMFGDSYRGHSAGRVFFTEKSGVMFWTSRVEDQLFDKFDDPPEVSVVRVHRELLSSMMEVDHPGTDDSKHLAWFVAAEVFPVKLSNESASKRRRIQP